MIIWAKATFLFEQLFRAWPEHGESWEVGLFLGPKSRFLAKKSDFCHTTPILVNDLFVALGVTVHFLPWEWFFDFPFRSYSCFLKKIRLTRQKVFPLPDVGAPSASNSPSALNAQALRARVLCGRAGLCRYNTWPPLPWPNHHSFSFPFPDPPSLNKTKISLWNETIDYWDSFVWTKGKGSKLSCLVL